MASRPAYSVAALFISCLGVADAAPRGRPPLPPVRPPDLKKEPAETKPGVAASPAPAPVSPPSTSAPPQAGDACLAQLNSDRVAAEAASAPAPSSAGCGIASPVRLKSIGLAGGGAIDLPARPILDCPFAAVFASFVRDLVAPLAQARLSASVAALDTGPGYDCRPRDRAPGAKISPHGTGVAIDVGGFVLADRRRLAVGHDANPQDAGFMQTIRRAGCGWFTTILGPGDPDHAEHFHFDVKQHGASENYRICE